jgi:hypothetical protein
LCNSPDRVEAHNRAGPLLHLRLQLLPAVASTVGASAGSQTIEGGDLWD